MRILQFIAIFIIGLGILMATKVIFGLSDYLIPPITEIISLIFCKSRYFFLPSLNTLFVAIEGHLLAIFFAVLVAFLAKGKGLLSNLVKTAAYNLQSYPVVAVAPIAFIFLGDGLASRLFIATLICYFPLLLSFLGIFSEPISDVEHFFSQIGQLNSITEISIRTFENLDKIVTVISGSGTLAMVGTIVAEFLASTNGIGYVIRKALYQNNLAAILASLLFIGLCSSFYLAFVEWLGRLGRERLMGN